MENVKKIYIIIIFNPYSVVCFVYLLIFTSKKSSHLITNAQKRNLLWLPFLFWSLCRRILRNQSSYSILVFTKTGKSGNVIQMVYEKACVVFYATKLQNFNGKSVSMKSPVAWRIWLTGQAKGIPEAITRDIFSIIANNVLPLQCYNFLLLVNKCGHRNVLSKRQVWMSIFHIINFKKKKNHGHRVLDFFLIKKLILDYYFCLKSSPVFLFQIFIIAPLPLPRDIKLYH
jgi:hypothetical protein